jgi:hypothetical protein
MNTRSVRIQIRLKENMPTTSRSVTTLFEFIIDCGQFYSENEEAQLHTRIITSPAYAKALLETLQESIDQYQQSFADTPDEDG